VINFKSILNKAEIQFNPSFIINGHRKGLSVQNYDKADYSRILDIIKWENKKRRLNLSEKFQVLMLSYFRAVGTLVIPDTRRPGHLKGIEIGMR
jgi:hypothetical protein